MVEYYLGAGGSDPFGCKSIKEGKLNRPFRGCLGVAMRKKLEMKEGVLVLSEKELSKVPRGMVRREQGCVWIDCPVKGCGVNMQFIPRESTK